MEEANQASKIKEVTITRVFDAPRELVFRAWTDPQLMAQWFGPHTFDIPVCELDPRPGGALAITMRDREGGLYPMTGVFKEVVAPERLVFTAVAIEDERGEPQLVTLDTVTLIEENGKTRLTLHIDVLKATPAVAIPLSGMEEGWSQSLEKLSKLIGK